MSQHEWISGALIASARALCSLCCSARLILGQMDYDEQRANLLDRLNSSNNGHYHFPEVCLRSRLISERCLLCFSTRAKCGCR